MPVTLQQLAARQATVTFPWEGDSVAVTYSPGKVTDNFMVQLDEGNAQRNAALSGVLVAWDVLDGDAPAAFDPESLAALDREFRDTVMFAIIDDMRSRPNRTATKTTPN